VVQACTKVDDRTAIFGVARCKTAGHTKDCFKGAGDVAGIAAASTVCPAGAQEALAPQARYELTGAANTPATR
jgi:hypothetical protein